MTLSIAAKYPWGPLRKLMMFQSDLPQAVIFVTDSRWTKYYPNDQIHFQDIGAKFFPFATDAGAVYAGDVISGEHCISELTTKLKSKRKHSFRVSMYIAQQTFQDVYNYHRRSRRTKVPPLYFLIGVCDKAGNASLMSFASPKFHPVFIEGIYGVGVKEAYKEYENVVNKEIESIVKEEFDLRSRWPALQKVQAPVQNNAEKVGMLIAAIMQTRVIDTTKHSTIGGPIQFAIITKEGIKTPELSWTTNGTGATDTWHRVTPTTGEITTYQDKYKLGPGFADSSSFGLYCISN